MEFNGYWSITENEFNLPRFLIIVILKNESKSRSNAEENVQSGSASYHTFIDVCSTPSPLIKVERHSGGPLPVVLHT